jgi:hypothetical protein
MWNMAGSSLGALLAFNFITAGFHFEGRFYGPSCRRLSGFLIIPFIKEEKHERPAGKKVRWKVSR